MNTETIELVILSDNMRTLLKRIDSGGGAPGRGFEEYLTAKKLKLIRRDSNGNTVVTRKGQRAIKTRLRIGSYGQP